MEFIIDKSGAPLIQFSERKYISVLPVTKYQFERYIWTTAPSWCDYEAMIQETGRISPSVTTKDNLSQVFVTNINFEEALEFSKWLGGRPPLGKEWDKAHKALFSRKDLLEETLRFLEKVELLGNRDDCDTSLRKRDACGTFSEKDQPIDKRLVTLLQSLTIVGITREDVNTHVGELISQFPAAPYGKISLKYQGSTAYVTGRPGHTTRSRNFGCSYVVEEVKT